MENTIVEIPMSDIILDETIYPRENIDHKRVLIFVENLRDGFEFDPIKIQLCPDQDLLEKKTGYRILDGAHRLRAYKKPGKVSYFVKTVCGIRKYAAVSEFTLPHEFEIEHEYLPS